MGFVEIGMKVCFVMMMLGVVAGASETIAGGSERSFGMIITLIAVIGTIGMTILQIKQEQSAPAITIENQNNKNDKKNKNRDILNGTESGIGKTAEE